MSTVAARTILVLLALSLTQPAGASAAVPLTLDASYDAVPTPDPSCRGFRVEGRGTASGHPLGPATWEDTECADLTIEPGAIRVRDGRLVLTVANGDRLEATYEARGTLPDAAGAIYLQGTWKVVGGTGRFSGSSGGGTVTAVANVFDPATTAHMEGVLRLRVAP